MRQIPKIVAYSECRFYEEVSLTPSYLNQTPCCVAAFEE